MVVNVPAGTVTLSIATAVKVCVVTVSVGMSTPFLEILPLSVSV